MLIAGGDSKNLYDVSTWNRGGGYAVTGVDDCVGGEECNQGLGRIQDDNVRLSSRLLYLVIFNV
jgi:hypothetical protein